jgi:hypothetical protein
MVTESSITYSDLLPLVPPGPIELDSLPRSADHCTADLSQT